MDSLEGFMREAHAQGQEVARRHGFESRMGLFPPRLGGAFSFLHGAP